MQETDAGGAAARDTAAATLAGAAEPQAAPGEAGAGAPSLSAALGAHARLRCCQHSSRLGRHVVGRCVRGDAGMSHVGLTRLGNRDAWLGG